MHRTLCVFLFVLSMLIAEFYGKYGLNIIQVFIRDGMCSSIALRRVFCGVVGGVRPGWPRIGRRLVCVAPAHQRRLSYTFRIRHGDSYCALCSGNFVRSDQGRADSAPTLGQINMHRGFAYLSVCVSVACRSSCTVRIDDVACFLAI